MWRVLPAAIAIWGVAMPSANAQSTVELNGGKCPVVDGKPFFAVGIYSAEIDDFPMLARAGFNLVHTYKWEGTADNKWGKAWLDAAAANSLKALVGLYRPSVRGGALASSAKRIETYRGHPALFAWHTMDEPAWDQKDNMGMDYMPAAREFVKKHDPLHPVTAVVCHFADHKRFESSVDVMQGDYYPIPPIPASNFSGTGFRGIKQHVDGWREASRGQKPFWFVCQAFDFSLFQEKGNTELKLPKEWSRFPTARELRTMTYTAVASGARGVLYWSLTELRSQVRPGGSTAEEHWTRLQGVTLELKQLMPLLAADTAEVITHKDSVVAMVKSDGKDTYVIAANYERKPTKTVIEIPGVDKATAEVVFGNSIVKINGGNLSVRLDSIESRVYRIAGSKQVR